MTISTDISLSMFVCVCVCVSEWGFSFFPAALPCSAQPSSFSLFSSNSALFAPQKIFVIQPLCLVTNKTLSCTCRFHNSTFISQATKKKQKIKIIRTRKNKNTHAKQQKKEEQEFTCTTCNLWLAFFGSGFYFVCVSGRRSQCFK